MKIKKDQFIMNLSDDIIKELSFERKEYLVQKRNELIKQSLIYTTITNKIVFILSVLIPSIGVIFQAIDLFVK